MSALVWDSISCRNAIGKVGQRLSHLFAEIRQNFNVRAQREECQVCGPGDARCHYSVSSGGRAPRCPNEVKFTVLRRALSSR